jgi:hypothetical protein
VKKTLLALALVSVLATMAMAAQHNVPASIGERIAVKGQPPVMQGWNAIHHDTAPKYCKPCLFYAGDFDSSNTGANGLWNGNSGGVLGDVYAPFSVSKAAKASGLFINILTSGSGTINNPTPYSVNTGVKSGSGGKVVAHGTGTATTAPTGRTGFGLTEVTLQIKKLKKAVSLKAKTVYFMYIEPQDSTGQLWYESDVEDVPPANHVGAKNHNDDSFFNSSFFGFTYGPTWGSSGVCAGTGCDMFSVGVTGK